MIGPAQAVTQPKFAEELVHTIGLPVCSLVSVKSFSTKLHINYHSVVLIHEASELRDGDLNDFRCKS